MAETQKGFLDIDYSKYDFKDTEKYVYKTRRGIGRDVVLEISTIKNEPEWMRNFRLEAYKTFLLKPMPRWGGDLNEIHFEDYVYFLKTTDKMGKSWDDVPDYIRKTFEKLGIPEAEQKFLAGVGAQYESEVVYHSIKEDLAKKGVVFLDTDSALKMYPDLFREYFGSVVSPTDNKFAALNSAVWSGGSFVYVPRDVRIDIPLQAYFRINAQSMGQFERTLIIADEGSSVHYIEGCTAPIYSKDSLHTAVVEIIAKKGSKVRYTTIQNWSKNIYNLVTKRAVAHEDATVEWIDGNMGSKVTMKYPCVYLLGRGAKAQILSIAYAGRGQHQDAGAKVIHAAPDTTSTITSKSVSKFGGRATYRGLLKVAKGAINVKANVRCDALLLDELSRSDTYPTMEIEEEKVSVAHEATVGKISEDQIFYLMSRGLTESEALAAIVLGFIEPFSKELPMEYAIELNRLIQLEMEGAIG
ncbi:MAG: Fe-S cluster assembly protein SufB [Nitrospinota bacterium]